MMKRRLWVLLVPAVLAGCGYNRIQELDERVEQQRSNIDTELERRAALIPNLVRTVDEAAAQERGTFVEVARARSGLNQAREALTQAVQSGADPDQVSQANAALNDNLRLYINVAVEAYPNLKFNQNFIALQDELTETENRIAVARQDYNESVQVYNTYIRRFPQALTAKITGAERKKPFQATPSSQQVPEVEFRSDTAAGR